MATELLTLCAVLLLLLAYMVWAVGAGRREESLRSDAGGRGRGGDPDSSHDRLRQLG